MRSGGRPHGGADGGVGGCEQGPWAAADAPQQPQRQPAAAAAAAAAARVQPCRPGRAGCDAGGLPWARVRLLPHARAASCSQI